MHIILHSSRSCDPVLAIHEGMAIHASEELQWRLAGAPDPVDLVHHEMTLIAWLHVLHALQLRLTRHRVELHEQLLEIGISLVVTTSLGGALSGLELLELLMLKQDVCRLLLSGLLGLGVMLLGHVTR